jgi:CRP/FNR family cyclic AMP-dependent transcriptional regulator
MFLPDLTPNHSHALLRQRNGTATPSDEWTIWRELPIFRHLPQESLTKFQKVSYQRAFPAGFTILTIERPTEFVYIILRGTIKIRALHEDGSEVILAILGPGEIVGDIIDEAQLSYVAMVETVEETTLLWLTRDDFQACLQSMPTLSYNVVQSLARRLRTTDSYLHSILRLDVPGRLAYRLLHFAQEYGQALTNGELMIPLRLTQSDLADLIGASRVRVNHAFMAFKRRGILSVGQDHRIVIHNLKLLATVCE